MAPDTYLRAVARRSVLALAAVVALILLSIGSVSAETVTIASVNFRFEPATRTVAVGDIVRWTFAGDPHTVTSGSPGAADGRFNSGIKNAGESYQITATTAGTFDYFCEIHPEQMFGTLVVSGGSVATPTPTAKPTPSPTARPTASPTARPTPRPTPAPTTAPTAAPTSSPSPSPVPTPVPTPLASESAAPSSTPTTAPSSASPSPTEAADGVPPSAEPPVAPDPGSAAAAVDPVPLVAAAIVLAGLVAGGLVLARRSGRI
ncbi:MAG: plastocyanin/azurin family copper-binding protein [Chloroflexota bacterium]